MGTIYHLDLDKAQLKGATLAFVPGDPDRCEGIVKAFDPNGQELARKREYCTWLGDLDGTPVIATSTGIGGPSTSIAIEELAMLGVTTFIRIGTTGAIQESIGLGDVVISNAAVRLDGASDHYAPISFPAVANFSVTRALVDAAATAQVPAHIGVTASCATFYPGQERYDSFSGYVPRHLQGSMKEWQALGVMNYEMESATLFTVCSALGLSAGCVAGVIVNRTQQEAVNEEILKSAEQNGTKVAIEAARQLLKG